MGPSTVQDARDFLCQIVRGHGRHARHGLDAREHVRLDMTGGDARHTHCGCLVYVLDFCVDALVYGDGCGLAGRIVCCPGRGQVSRLRSNDEQMAVVVGHQGWEESLDCP